jgi:membrane protein YqaA with SNARE-associated domain
VVTDSQAPAAGPPAADDPLPNDTESSDVNGRSLAIRTVFGVVLLFAGAAVGAWLLKDGLTRAGVWFFEVYGLVGLVLGTLATDVLGVPVPVDVYLAASITADKPVLPILAVASVTSVISGNLAYLLGGVLDKIPLLGRLVRRYEDKGRAVFAKWGVTAVAIAAWTPLPFSIVCWFAGAFRMPYKRFFLATLHRVPRIILYYYVIALGWMAGAA